MADSSEKMTERKKRKPNVTAGSEQRPPKTQRIEISSELEEEKEKKKKKKKKGAKEVEQEVGQSSKQKEFGGKIEFGRPWRNLQLILSLQSKEIELQRKVELAFDYVSSRVEGSDDIGEDCETVKLSRLVVFLSDWVQSLLVSGNKKIRVGAEETGCGEVIEACLDYRCWVVFRFCLEESVKLRVSLNFSRNLLRAIGFIARNAFSYLGSTPLGAEDSEFVRGGFGLYGVVLDCASLVFVQRGGLSNENLDLWISTVAAVLQLVLKIFTENLESSHAGVFVLHFSCLVLEPFAKFLRIHPTRKNGFRDFVDKLLEPLLHLLGVLCSHVERSNPTLRRNLLAVVEEILSQGLFHSTHIEGFLSLRSAQKYSEPNDGKMKDSKTVIKSYHRHLFDNVERAIAEKKESISSGLGELFRLLVGRVKKQKGASLQSEDTKMPGRTRSGNSELLDDNVSSNLNAEKRKLLFDVFVQIMEPLLIEMNSYLQKDLQVEHLSVHICSTLESINNLLSSFFHEKLYVKTEDASEGACLNFLKKVYGIVLSFATNLLCLPTYDLDNQRQGLLTSAAKEALVAVGHLLEIEYEVIESDVSSLWLMMLSYLAIDHSFKDAPDRCPLLSQILGLGCQLIKLYSDLRQVKHAIFALCKAIRSIVVHNRDSDGELKNHMVLSFSTSLPSEACAKSVELLLCTQEFRSTIHNGIKFIPEGQATECIQQLSTDLTESIQWMKYSYLVFDAQDSSNSSGRQCSMLRFDLQAELFGRGLSEIYSLVLESLSVTVGNSSLLARSIENLMAAIRPCMSILVGHQSNSINEFLSFVTGITSDACLLEPRGSTCWIFVFFFRLYLSCRSLYRQAISLMPPGLSRKRSEAMGDLFAAHSGMDWMQRTDWTNKCYFAWIVQPSASLLVLIQLVSDVWIQGGLFNCYPLIYVLSAMVLQRLADLNRHIRSLDYIQESNDKILQTQSLDDTGLSLCCEKSEKLGRCLSVMKQEADDLTKFVMRQLSIYCLDHATCLNGCAKTEHKWDLGVCSLNKESLPTAIWWLICQNIDIWSIHGSKKKLKMFVSELICTSIPSITRSFTEVQKHQMNGGGLLQKISVHQISSDLLTDTFFYEHRFVRRHLASRFCRIFQGSVLQLFRGFLSADMDLKSLPDWEENLSMLEKLSMVDSASSEGKPTHTLFKVPEDSSRESTSMDLMACQSLLRFLCWMPKGYTGSRSFSLYATHVLNVERLGIGCLLKYKDALSSHQQCELLRLLVSCRRALKYITVAYYEENARSTESPLVPLLPQGSSSMLWLSKSVNVVVELQRTLNNDCADEVRDMMFSLVDHTFYLYQTLSKNICACAVDSATVQTTEAWESVLHVAESLKEQTQQMLNSSENAIHNEKLGDSGCVVYLSRVSSIASCFNGFLWGLASQLEQTNATDTIYKAKLLRWKAGSAPKFSLCIDVFVEFITFFLHKYFIEDGNAKQCLENFETPHDRSGLLVSGKYSVKDLSENGILCDKQLQKSGAETTGSASSDPGEDPENPSVPSVCSKFEDASSVASILSKVDSYNTQLLNKNLLQSLPKGHHPEAAILLRQLFIASSAILRLNLLTKYTPSLFSLMPALVGISQCLLLNFVDTAEMAASFSFVWLDGVLMCLQELGKQLPSGNPALTGNVCAKLIYLHFKALGKCIALQGKRATLSSHESEPSTKILCGHLASSEASPSRTPSFVDEFKARLRMSFQELIRKPSESHLSSAIQAVERALVAVKEGCTVFYEINTGSSDGGKVSSTVAAGIDCLDLILEYTSGSKRLDVVKRHVQSSIAALFNIVFHLQSPSIFYSTAISEKTNPDPDPGSVILMCVEVLTRISGKPNLHMGYLHVAESLRIPAAIFQVFCKLRLPESPIPSNSFLSVDNQEWDPLVGINSRVIDPQFSVELFAACCKLLYTTLKHHKSESEPCVAVLQESARVLLHCLEMVDANTSTRNGSFVWGVQEGEICARFFRRIYEEIRQQKDVFGRHCFKFLSDYIWVCSGYGPHQTGIKREIDEALKPGVYALIDACSVDDLQHLHSVFGEGPCRNTLATLQHYYKQNFQYEGKV